MSTNLTTFEYKHQHKERRGKVTQARCGVRAGAAAADHVVLIIGSESTN